MTTLAFHKQFSAETRTISANYTLADTDANTVIVYNGSANIVVTCGEIGEGRTVIFGQHGNGTITFVAGATRDPRSLGMRLTTAGPNARVTGIMHGAYLFLSGDLQ